MDKLILSTEEQIEYRLGKDHLPNLHWQPSIPASWEIPPRAEHMQLCCPESRNSTVVLNSIEYKLNNLGYRSNFDYNINELAQRDIILVLGDSDASGRGVTFNEMYSTRMQQQTEYCVVNLGIPGLSGDGMSRVGVNAMLALGSAVKHVCVLWPGMSLREFVSKTFKCGVHTVSKSVPYTGWWEHIDWVSNNYNYQKNKALIERTAISIGAQYHDLIINRNEAKSVIKYKDEPDQRVTFTEFAPETHTAIASYFIKQVNNQPSLYTSSKQVV